VKTVLEYVKSALRSIGSDSVNSISDTPEAQDCANMLKDVYMDLMTTRDWPHLKEVYQLVASGDADKPTVMSLERPVQKIYYDTLYYDKQAAGATAPDWDRVKFLEFKDFLDRQMRLSSQSDESNVQAVSTGELTYFVYNDRAPEYYTSINDETLLFDAFDSAVDSTLQNSKSQVVVYKEPEFSVQDSHIPDIPRKNESYLLAEFKSVVAVEIAQEANPKQEQISREHRAWSSREKFRIGGGIKHAANFGRK
jgi:hypothetical protein